MKPTKAFACSVALATVILGGVTATLPTALAQSAPVSVKIRLKGAAINRVVPEGSAEVKARAGRSSFQVEAERVNLPDGTVLTAALNGGPIAMLKLVAGRAKFEQEGRGVSAVRAGDVVTIATADGKVILKGTF
jgi:hypothetical protein